MNRGAFLAGAAALAGAPALTPKSVAAVSRRVRFGVNYVPSKNWWYCWSDWDRDSIRRDLDDIAALRADHIRIQLLWPVFQPNAGTVNDEASSRLESLLADAGERGLDVEVTVLDGQLSGFLFVPPFLIDGGSGRVTNAITDPGAIETQKALFAALAARIGGRKNFLGFDIANEIYWFTEPLGMHFTTEQGDEWARELLAACEAAAPGKLHVNGVDKWPYESAQAHAFARAALLRDGAASCIHPWAGFGNVFRTAGPLGTASTHYAEFYLQYMQAFSSDGARTLWVEEDGCSKRWMPEETIPLWAASSIRNAASCEHLFGITWWCSHDLNPRLRGFNALEYDLGLYTNDRRLKPLGKAVRDAFAELDANPAAALARPQAIAIDDAAGGEDVLPRYAALIDRGIRPQIILRSRASDKEYLASRGITTISG